MRSMIFLIAIFISCGLQAQSEMRKWTGSNGTEIQAELVSFTKDSIKIKMEDGEIKTVAKEKFSKEDVDWVESLVPFSGLVCSAHDKLNRDYSEVSGKKMQVLHVDEVIPDSPADKAGIKKGVVFSTVGGMSFKDGTAYEKWVANARPGSYAYRFHRISKQVVQNNAIRSIAGRYPTREIVQDSTVRIQHQWRTKRDVEQARKEASGRIEHDKLVRNPPGGKETAEALNQLIEMQEGLSMPLALSNETATKLEGLSIVSCGNDFYGRCVRYKGFDVRERSQRISDKTLHNLKTWDEIALGPVFLNEGNKTIKDAILGMDIKDKATGHVYHENIPVYVRFGGLGPDAREMFLAHAFGSNHFPLPVDRNFVCEIWIESFRYRDGSIAGNKEIWKNITIENDD